jgi:hypothetical protein
MLAFRLPVHLTQFLLTGAALTAVIGAIAQVGPSLTASEVVPWRQPTGWFLFLCGLVLACTAWRCAEPVVCQLAFWRWLLSGLILLYALTVLTVGGSASARYVFRALSLGWVVAVARLSLRSHAGWTRAERRCWRYLDLAATNVALFLLLGELSLRAYAAWSGQSLLVQSGMEAYRLAPHRNYGGLLFTNSLGYASREFERDNRPGVRRIAALGDSFAVGVVHQEQNYLTVLETLLPDTEVYNFGVAGIGPREYYEILQSEVWPFSPDLVLVSFFVGNDVLDSMHLSVKATGAKRRRMHPESLSLYVFAQRAWRLGREYYRRWQATPGWERLQQAYEVPGLSLEAHLQVEQRRLDVCRLSQVPALEPRWEHALASLDKIILACRKRGVTVAVVLIPDEFQVNSALLEEVLQFSQVPRADVDLDLPQRRLMDFCAERQVRCLDLKLAFVGVPETYRPRDTHWNERGNRLAAEQIGQWLQVKGSSLAW